MLLENVFPIFLVKFTLIIHGISITRLQIPIMLGFAVIEYKDQAVIFLIAVFNLYKNTKLGNKSSYKKFCSIYIQLLYLQILDRI